MNVADMFQSLSFGELSNLSMSNGGTGTIIEEQQPKIIRHANEALLRLYSRFVLYEDSVLIEMVRNITTYELKPKFCQSYQPPEGQEPEKHLYIKDAADPFKNNVIRILKVFNSLGFEQVLNNESNQWSLFTPRPKTLQVPMPIHGQALAINYQARHPKLLPGNLSAEIDVPEVLEGAFMSHVASNVFTDMGGTENLQRGQLLMAKSEAICVEAEAKDVISVSNSTSATLFEKQGYV